VWAAYSAVAAAPGFVLGFDQNRSQHSASRTASSSPIWYWHGASLLWPVALSRNPFLLSKVVLT
jgi:hypothetical protein